MNPRMKNVLSLDKVKRYKFTLTEACECEEIWVLKNKDGLVQYETENGKMSVPIWPGIEFAELYIKDEWSEAEALEYTLEELFYDLIPMIIEHDVFLYVFPNLDFSNENIIKPKVFVKDLLDIIEDSYGETYSLDYLD